VEAWMIGHPQMSAGWLTSIEGAIKPKNAI
jgi:hypothetical protein